MFIVGAALITAGTAVVGSVVSSNAQKSAAKKAANAQRDASDAQIALQREQLARAEQMARPYQERGNAADATLAARWGGSGPGFNPMASAYGVWGQAANNARPGSVYDPYSGGAMRTTAAGAPQVARAPGAYTMPDPPQPQAAAGWHPSQVNRSMLPPLPGAAPIQQQPAPSQNQGQGSNAYGGWQSWRGDLPNHFAAIF